MHCKESMVIGALIMNSVNRSQKQLFENCLKYFIIITFRCLLENPAQTQVRLTWLWGTTCSTLFRQATAPEGGVFGAIKISNSYNATKVDPTKRAKNNYLQRQISFERLRRQISFIFQTRIFIEKVFFLRRRRLIVSQVRRPLLLNTLFRQNSRWSSEMRTTPFIDRQSIP